MNNDMTIKFKVKSVTFVKKTRTSTITRKQDNYSDYSKREYVDTSAPSESSKQEQKSIKVPKSLSKIVSNKKWNKLPRRYQEDCYEILTHPNTYFFRKRPSWEKLKFGSFTTQEEQLFFKRYEEFKAFGIVNAQWGFFAIPFIGRVGYQLSTFYRTQVKIGKIIDKNMFIDSAGKMRQISHKQKMEISAEASEKMMNEAAEFLLNELHIDINSEESIQTSPTKRKNKHYCSDEESNDEEEEHEEESLEEKPKNKRINKTPVKFKESKKEDNGMCIVMGARDPLTGRPMRRPAMNLDGYVMDIDSWKLVLYGKREMPFDSTIPKLNDLTMITSKTYDSLKESIVNLVM